MFELIIQIRIWYLRMKGLDAAEINVFLAAWNEVIQERLVLLIREKVFFKRAGELLCVSEFVHGIYF